MLQAGSRRPPRRHARPRVARTRRRSVRWRHLCRLASGLDSGHQPVEVGDPGTRSFQDRHETSWTPCPSRSRSRAHRSTCGSLPPRSSSRRRVYSSTSISPRAKRSSSSWSGAAPVDTNPAGRPATHQDDDADHDERDRRPASSHCRPASHPIPYRRTNPSSLLSSRDIQLQLPCPARPAPEALGLSPGGRWRCLAAAVPARSRWPAVEHLGGRDGPARGVAAGVRHQRSDQDRNAGQGDPDQSAGGSGVPQAGGGAAAPRHW